LETSVSAVQLSAVVEFRTSRTVNAKLRARAREESTANIDIDEDFQEKLKDLEGAVRAVRVVEASPRIVAGGERLPYLTPGGTLVIPFNSPQRYHWWKPDGERLSVAEIMCEVKERMDCAADF
jgi:hypothetical protein